MQAYPAKGTHFPGWIVNYSYPGDVGFDILLQPTKKSLGPWSFRAEAQKIDGHWKITTWYPVATFAPAGQTQTVLGPNDLGPANGSASASTPNGRLPPWVLVLPVGLLAAIALGGAGYGVTRWARQRSRVRELRALARLRTARTATLRGWRTTTSTMTTESRRRPRSARSPSLSR